MDFGVTLVVSSKEKLVTAREVLAAGPWPQPMLETVIITLMHISIYGEEVELEVYVLPFHFVYLFRVLFYVRQRTSNIPRVSAGHFPAKQYTLNIYIQKICFASLWVLYVLVSLIFLIAWHTVLVV